MASRLRRGTDAERQSITPKDGEMIWTTDNKELYVGDGTTVGGNKITGIQTQSFAQLSQNLALGGYTINGTGAINISGNVTATQLVGDGSQITNINASNLNVSDLVVEGGNYKLSVVGNDSSIIVDYNTNNISANNITATGTIFGHLDGDLEGSVYSDTSTLVIDGTTGFIHASNCVNTDGLFTIDGSVSGQKYSTFRVKGGNPASVSAGSTIQMTREDTSADLSTDANMVYGKLQWARVDTNGTRISAQIVGDPNRVWMGQSTDGGAFPPSNIFAMTEDGKFGFGTYSPTEEFQVDRKATFNQTITLPKFANSGDAESSPIAGDVYYNTSVNRFWIYNGTAWQFPLIATEGETYLPNTLPIQQPNYTTTQRNSALTGAQQVGVSFYNTTVGMQQIWNGTTWANIPQDGGTFKGDVVGSIAIDDSSKVLDGTSGAITAPGTVQLASYTTAQRDALTAANGMIIYNSQLNKFQGYENGSWANLI